MLYVNFAKAYDKVPRNALLSALCRLGCGYMMILALYHLYSDTKMILGAAVITATVGVKQGSPTSCFLFTLYINELIRDLKRCPHDGFLKWIHCLLLMDDTVLLSTTREGCIRKANILMNFCKRSGMEVNQGKTKFMVINGTEYDKSPIVLNTSNLTIENCSSYLYLGVLFTQDGKVNNAVKRQMLDKQCHVAKFAAFISKNSDLPFLIKKRVMEAALFSSILYGHESWIGSSASVAQVVYHNVIKILLGVRITTSNDLCLMELNYPSLSARVKASQQKFLGNLLKDRHGMADDPFIAIWKICSNARTCGAKYLQKVLEEQNHVSKDIDHRKSVIRQSNRTKYKTYYEINPDLNVHLIYLNKDMNVPEYQRTVCLLTT